MPATARRIFAAGNGRQFTTVTDAADAHVDRMWSASADSVGFLSYGHCTPNGAPSPQTRVEVLGNIGPNSFAAVMGTGIVAIAGATLPVHVVGLRAFTEVVWVIAAILLVALIIVVGGYWLRHPTVARSTRAIRRWSISIAPRPWR